MIQRARMGFEPFAPALDLQHEVDTTPNFRFAARINCHALDRFPREEFERLVLFHVVLCGVPLVIEGFQGYLDRGLFSEHWLQQKYSDKSK